MKHKKFWKDVSRFVTPAALIVLGLVLLFCPDTASALISRVAGWALTFSGIVVAVAMVVDGRLSVGQLLSALALVLLGRYLIAHPLAWAAWGGRIIGVLVLLRGARDFTLSTLTQGKILAVVTALVGVMLIFLPLTASRMVFSLCGIVVLVVGGGMLWERIWERKFMEGDDPNIIDAL